MSQYLMPFGIGTRVCGGQNLAHIVLRVATASMAVNFDITANLTETNEQSMEIKDAFVSILTFCFALACSLNSYNRSFTPSQRSVSLSSRPEPIRLRPFDPSRIDLLDCRDTFYTILP